LAPDTQYLFVTVIDIEARQYARIERGGLFVMLDRGAAGGFLGDLVGMMKGSLAEGEFRPLKSLSGILMA
tara:strand:+ start:2158 stop:2367 length:210 start_codon:yes stop_codon:yes gene_type:complete